VARPIRARAGKVYVDWGQNGQGQTIVAPFSVRPLPGAPVSCPLTWDEVTPDLDPARFSIRTAPARLQERGDPLAPVLTGAIDLAAARAAVERAFDGGQEPRGPAATPSRTARGSGERERGRRPIPRA
jgi:bifunctional non-homologous end joining protein LigD